MGQHSSRQAAPKRNVLKKADDTNEVQSTPADVVSEIVPVVVEQSHTTRNAATKTSPQSSPDGHQSSPHGGRLCDLEALDELDVCAGRHKMRRILRRRSSIKVSPSNALANLPSPQLSPLIPDNSPSFLFSGRRTPMSPTTLADGRDGWLTTTQLYNSLNDSQLDDSSFLLLVDTRHTDDYNECRIEGATPSSQLSQIAVNRFTLVVVYDHKGLSMSLRDSPLSAAVALIRSRGTLPFMLRGGFDGFHAEHPYLCTPQYPATMDAVPGRLQYPSLILDSADNGPLFLGRADQASNWRVMQDLRITHVVNVSVDHPSAFPDKLTYLDLPLNDGPDTDLLSACDSITQFLRNALYSQESAVLVHCNQGISRGAAVVIAFLMASRNWTLRDALDFVRDRRPVVQPNNSFIQQLCRFEDILYGRRYTKSGQLHK